MATVKTEPDDSLWIKLLIQDRKVDKTRQSRTTSPHPDKGKSKRLLHWSRNSVRRVVGAYTGHCLLREHAKILRVVTDYFAVKKNKN